MISTWPTVTFQFILYIIKILLYFFNAFCVRIWLLIIINVWCSSHHLLSVLISFLRILDSLISKTLLIRIVRKTLWVLVLIDVIIFIIYRFMMRFGSHFLKRWYSLIRVFRYVSWSQWIMFMLWVEHFFILKRC